MPSSAYTPFTVSVPNGPGGTVDNPKPTTVTVYNLDPALVSADEVVGAADEREVFLADVVHGRG